jgi:hypothetical protein
MMGVKGLPLAIGENRFSGGIDSDVNDDDEPEDSRIESAGNNLLYIDPLLESQTLSQTPYIISRNKSRPTTSSLFQSFESTVAKRQRESNDSYSG